MERFYSMEDIKDALREMGYTIIDNGDNYRTSPIYRDSNSKDVLSVQKSTGKWYDFKEGKGGSFDELVRKTLNFPDIKQAKDWVSSKIRASDNLDIEKPLIEEAKLYPNEYLTKLLPIHDYWATRGISEETLSPFKGGLVKSGKMSGRYVFPIFNSKNGIVGFAGRDTFNNSDRPKWKLLGRKSNWCYPLAVNKNNIRDSKEVYIVESIGDMLSLWQAGINNAVVTFGLNLSASLIIFLIKADMNKIIISFNNDSANNDAGNLAANEARSKLINHFDERQVSIKIPFKKDFGEMSKEEILQWKNS